MAAWQLGGAILNKMENPSFVHDAGETGRDAASTVELGEIEKKVALGCPQACVSLQKQQMAKKQLPESPWHQLKSIFLVGTLLLLAAWLIVYITLSQLDVL